ncbi:MAG: beta-mannosidase, partial [Clostridiales bacterium]|nr:beta-mannosidase [Clostridiales bacterium]
MRKYIRRITIIMVFSLVFLFGCNTKDYDESSKRSLEGAENSSYDPDFRQLIEAEEAMFTGKVRVEKSKKGYTGTGYLTG